MPSRRHIDLFSKPPSTPNDWEVIQKAIRVELVRNVQRVRRHSKHQEFRCHDSVYIGNAGFALMGYRLASLPIPIKDDILSPQTLIANADQDLALAFRLSRVRRREISDAARASFLETDIGVETLLLQRYPWASDGTVADHASWQACSNSIANTINMIEAETSDKIWDDGCEVLYGRAGFLYALLLLRTSVHGLTTPDQLTARDQVNLLRSLTSDEKIEHVVRNIIDRGRNGSERYASEIQHSQSFATPALMWNWHGKRYMGGAHGVVGILHMLLSCPKNIVAKYYQDIVSTLDWLLHMQDSAGNWPTQASSGYITDQSDLIQWCHGAPGMILLLSSVLRHSRRYEFLRIEKKLQDRIITSLHRAAALVYQHGVLRKGIGLCHGVGGSIYALLAVSDVLDSPEEDVPYLTQAAHLAHLATYHETLTSQGEMKVPDHPWSLYEGLGGMCCAWAEVLCRLETVRPRACSGMPGYDDIDN